jgi:catechol 2,3-dioxygenase-like lactoylglutathione lyase family enzyme
VLASPVVHVEQVDFISIPTQDVARAIAWYRDVLGLPESEVTDGELETPNVTLSFWEPEREDLLFAPNEAGFAIRVSDVSAARAELEANGVEFISETWDSGVCHVAAVPGRAPTEARKDASRYPYQPIKTTGTRRAEAGGRGSRATKPSSRRTCAPSA